MDTEPAATLVVRIEFHEGAQQRSFDELLDGAARFETQFVDPLAMPELGQTFQPLQAQARFWARQFPPSGKVVVLAYCSGAALALALAQEVGALQVEVLLFDPIRIGRQDVEREVAAIAAGLDESPATDGELLWPSADSVPELYCSAKSLLGRKIQYLDTELPADIDAEVKEQLVVRYSAWIGYLLAAEAVQPALSQKVQVHQIGAIAGEDDVIRSERARKLVSAALER